MATEAEISIRVWDTLDLKLRGYSRAKIVDITTNKYKVCEKTADTYIAKAKHLLNENNQVLKTEMIALQKARYDDLLQKAYDNNDYKEARAIIESINKLFGLEAPKALDVTSGGEKIVWNEVKKYDKE